MTSFGHPFWEVLAQKMAYNTALVAKWPPKRTPKKDPFLGPFWPKMTPF
jgi:hypothetical protein